MVRSLCDTDFYKLTMMQVVLHKFASAWVRYAFKWRNWDQMHLNCSLQDFKSKIDAKIDRLCELRFQEDELKYLAAILFFKVDFIEYLRLFQLNRSYITTHVANDELKINIEGPWLNTILFEVPVLSIVSATYTEMNGLDAAAWRQEGRKRLQDKVTYLEKAVPPGQGFKFADFGTRRRASYEWQEEVLQYLISHCGEKLVGTSNVRFAMKLGIKPIGTMAHEFLQAHQQLGPRLVDSQKVALQSWADEYRGELGIALSDTMGFDKFLKDFDRFFSLLFDGCRHDSGDPVSWTEKLIAHYKKMRIDPGSKAAVYSDGLTMETAVDLFRRFHSQIKTSFGIGTYLTNDCGFVAPQVVIKMVACNRKPVAKVSDSGDKGMCEDPEFLDYLKKVIREDIDMESH
ncbi:MAG: nicotinate phosphoribosyltransferase [Desulfobacterales bacterium]|nr:MAG: nicotinate phosphoribosyltransferase [Desulfobacterales bacterium]